MGKKDELLQIFNIHTSGNNYYDGIRIVENDLITDLHITTEDEIICIDSGVISENLFSEFTVKVELDCRKRAVISTNCTCEQFEKHKENKKNYCCKHIAATFYKSLVKLEKMNLFNTVKVQKKEKTEKVDDMLKMLLGERAYKQDVSFQVYINKDRWDHSINAEFKISTRVNGRKKAYVLKDIDHFMTCYQNKAPITYGNDFTFSYKTHKLSIRDMKLIGFIETLMEMDREKRVRSSQKGYYDGKYLIIPQYMLRQFFETVENHRVALNDGFFSRVVDTEIIIGRPPFDMEMSMRDEGYALKSNEGLPKVLGSKGDVFLYGTTIYLPDFRFCQELVPYLRIFNQSNEVVMSKSSEEEILRELIPKIQRITTNVRLDQKIKRKIVQKECYPRFYFDGEGKDITLEVKVKYGEYEFNIFDTFKDKVIYRDSNKEGEVIALLDTLKFQEKDDVFYFEREDHVFKFFKYEINKLQMVGEVFYSERFKGIKNLNSKGIEATIKTGKYDYFEMDFKIGKIHPNEMRGILRSFRENMKYYKLKNGEFLDLENYELKKLFKLIEAISPDGINEDKTLVSKNRSAFIYDYIDENEMNYVKGTEMLQEVKEKMERVKDLEISEPKNLKGELREYQKVGFNWMKTMQYLQFGGILGDEMGLGKTLQAITYLLSNDNEKSLVVVPTSLIYNWIDEFQKFAPSIRVGNVTGTKKKRDGILDRIGEFDVILTTYNTLRRDLGRYEEIYFNNVILDEAQFIKNPHSQIAKAVKKIESDMRFALTGTPLENSLMELWSIFDFVMPGYLYNEKRFSVRYHKKLKEGPEVLGELNRLIKPFILRRSKEDVLKELPSKIETHLKVDMSKEQKKIYATYANHAVDLIEKRVKDNEFKRNKIEILSYITKLRQLCLHPGVVTDNYEGGSGKIEALMELLHRSIDEGHKVLLFSQFTSVLKIINERMEREGIKFSYLDGSMTAVNRMKRVKEFNEGENSVFAISLKAGGTGLNLTSADVVIHFDPWWNPAVEDQATDRAHRMGQKKVVEVVKIIARGTIEEKIITLQEEKKNLISKIMDNGISKENGFASLGDDEIFELFDIKRALD